MVINHDTHKLARIEPVNGELVHAMATHLELLSQSGAAIGLDATHARELAAALRTVAETADLNARAYNNMVEIDEHQRALGRKVRLLAGKLLWLGLVVWAAWTVWHG